MYDSAYHTAPLLPSGVKRQHVSDPLIKVRLQEELIMRRERSWQWPQSSQAQSEDCAFEAQHCYPCLAVSGHTLEDPCVPVFISCDLASENTKP